MVPGSATSPGKCRIFPPWPPKKGSRNMLKFLVSWLLNECLKNNRVSLVVFSAVYRNSIRTQRALLKTFYPSATGRLALLSTSWGKKKRIVLTNEFRVDMASVVLAPARSAGNGSDQRIVDALISESQPTLDAFLRRQEANPEKLYWDRQFSAERVRKVSDLLDADEDDFVIVVDVQGDGLLRILDGHHRFRVREIRGSQTVRVLVGIDETSILSSNPLSSFINEVRKRPSRLDTRG